MQTQIRCGIKVGICYRSNSSNREEINKEINKFLDAHNFKSYYTRVWEENGRLIFDVGSHTEFFLLEGMSFEEWSNNK